MAKITIRVDPRTGVTYFPKEIRQEGFIGKIEGLPNALTFTLIKPGSKLADVESSLKIILADIALRRGQEVDANPKMEDEEPAKLPTGEKEIAPTGCHPLFAKYPPALLSEATGYSRGYLSRLATGRVSVSRSFVQRMCYKFGKPEAELFLPEGILPPEKCEDLEK